MKKNHLGIVNFFSEKMLFKHKCEKKEVTTNKILIVARHFSGETCLGKKNLKNFFIRHIFIVTRSE